MQDSSPLIVNGNGHDDSRLPELPQFGSSSSFLSSSSSSSLFKDCTFCISGPLSTKQNEFKRILKDHGGSVGVTVSKKTTHLITSQGDFESRTEKVEKALQRGGCFLVSEQFIHDSITSGVLKDPSEYQFVVDPIIAALSLSSDANSHPFIPISQSSLSSSSSSSSSSSFSSSRPGTQKIRARNSSISTPKAPKTKKARIERTTANYSTWAVETGWPAFGIYIDDEVALCSNDRGWVIGVDKDSGEVKTKIKLSGGVKVLKRDRGGFLYASCDDGSLWDITNLDTPKLMRPSPSGGKRSIMWSDVYDGTLIVTRENGRCCLLDIEGDICWEHHEPYSACWTVKTNQKSVFYSGDNVVIALGYEDGELQWKRKIVGLDHVTYGTLLGEDTLLLAGEGLYEFKVSGAGFAAKRGDNSDNVDWELIHYLPPRVRQPEDDNVDYDAEAAKERGEEWEDWFYCCTATDTLVFAGGEEHLYIFPRGDGSPNSRIELAWTFGTSMGMQVFGDSLYVVTETGVFVRVPFIHLPDSPSSDCPPSVPLANYNFDETSPGEGVALPLSSLETISLQSVVNQGVILECVKEAGQLKVKVSSLTEGYNKEWYVQFPSNLRKQGTKYFVEGLLPAGAGGYYRAKGEIKRISD